MTDLDPTSESPSPSPTPPASRREVVVTSVIIGFVAIALLISLIPIGSMFLFWAAFSVEEKLRVVPSPGDRYQLHVNYT